jgi:hypothetical protein
MRNSAVGMVMIALIVLVGCGSSDTDPVESNASSYRSALSVTQGEGVSPGLADVALDCLDEPDLQGCDRANVFLGDDGRYLVLTARSDVNRLQLFDVDVFTGSSSLIYTAIDFGSTVSIVDGKGVVMAELSDGVIRLVGPDKRNIYELCDLLIWEYESCLNAMGDDCWMTWGQYLTPNGCSY